MVCPLQKNSEKGVGIWVLRLDIVYGIQNKIENIILCLHQSIEEKCFITKKRKVIGEILKKLWECKGMNIPKTEVCPDYVRMLVKISPSASSFVGYLKWKSSTM